MTQERALYEISGFDVPVLQRELSGAWENAGEWTGPAGPSQVAPRNGTETLTYMGAAIHGGDVTLNSAVEVESLQVGEGSLEIGGGGSLVTHSEGRVSAAWGETAEVRVIGEDAHWEHLGEELEVGGEGMSRLMVGEGGAVFVQGVLALDDRGVLGGDGGTIHGNVLNREGLLSPGASAGTLTIAGDYQQLEGGTLHFEFFGLPESELNDLLVVTGAVDLAGTMWLDFSQFAATEGMSFRFMQAGSWIDNGVAYEVSGLASGLGFTNSSLGEIQIIPEPSSYVLLFGALAFGCLTGVRRNYTLVNAGRLAGSQDPWP